MWNVVLDVSGYNYIGILKLGMQMKEPISVKFHNMIKFEALKRHVW